MYAFNAHCCRDPGTRQLEWSRHAVERNDSAMAAGLMDRLWEVSDLVALLEVEELGLDKASRAVLR